MSPDLLDHVQVTVQCNSCDDSYAVPASAVRESQHVLAEGCTGTSSYECEASFYATLIDHDAIESLERVWTDFCRSATAHGATRVAFDTDPPVTGDLDGRALQRWENEGGRCTKSTDR
jgi:hypothetical protein